MKLHFLRYFLVLAEELHYGRAARRLSITQPPLSTAMKSLEDELGVKLFIRDSKHVELTLAGTGFLEETRYTLERLDRAVTNAKLAENGTRGSLEIGITGSMIYREVPSIVRAFKTEMPDVSLELREMASANQLDSLHRGRLDAGFLNAATVSSPLKAIALKEDEFVLCVHETHPKAQSRSVDLKDFANDQFVMFTREVAPANHDNVIAIFTQAGIHPKVVHATRQWLTIIAMVANGFGIAIVPKTLAKTSLHGVRFIKLRGKAVTSPASLAWNPEQLSPLAKIFLNIAHNVIQRNRPIHSLTGSVQRMTD